MKISIITVTLNNRAGLLRAIESVRSQTYKNVEHIIVDGGSTDGTIEAINNLQLSIYNLQFLCEADNGIYDAINKGIKLASGEVIGLLHSDDFYADESVLERYAEAFSQSAERQAQRPFDSPDKSGQAAQGDNHQPTTDHRLPAIDAVYSDLVYVREKSNVKCQMSKLEDNENTANYLHLNDYSVIRKWKTQRAEFTTEAQRRREILNGWMPPHPTLFVRREIFEKYGLYRTDMKIAADYEMILRLFYKYNITTHYLPVTTYCMTIGGTSNKSLKNILLKSKEDFNSMKLHSLPFPVYSLLLKNLRKISQFFK